MPEGTSIRDVEFLGFVFFLPALLAYVAVRICFRLAQARGGYGLVADAVILVATFVPSFLLVQANVRHDPGCLAFAKIGDLGLWSVAAFVPSVPSLRVRLGRWAPAAGLAIGLAAVTTAYFTYFIDPHPDYRNCL